VRGLTADNSKLKGELKAMRAQQNAADRLLASVLSSPSSAFGYPSLINSDVGRADAALACKPRAVKKERKTTRSAEEADQTEAEASLPPTALMDAVHELPFLRDYPSLAGFAIPDFRYRAHTQSLHVNDVDVGPADLGDRCEQAPGAGVHVLVHDLRPHTAQHPLRQPGHVRTNGLHLGTHKECVVVRWHHRLTT
jgi:hypothetical protein